MDIRNFFARQNKAKKQENQPESKGKDSASSKSKKRENKPEKIIDDPVPSKAKKLGNQPEKNGKTDPPKSKAKKQENKPEKVVKDPLKSKGSKRESKPKNVVEEPVSARSKPPKRLAKDSESDSDFVAATPPHKKIKCSKEMAIPKSSQPSEAKVTSSLSSNAKATSPQPSQSKSVSSQPSEASPSSLMWVDKYKPSTLKQIIGQQGDKSNMNKLIDWIQKWTSNHTHGVKPPSRPPPWKVASDNGAWAKAALLSGPPGVGKTTTAYLVAKHLGYDVMEMNASDTRSKKLLEASISDAVSSQSLSRVSKKRILLMDEVDGMAGNEDRGGMAELMQLIKASKIPIICMCNDRNATAIRSLANHCFDLRFQRPRAEQIKAAMMSVCFKEKVKITPEALMELIIGCNHDVRQVLHSLSMIKNRASDEKIGLEEAKREAEKSKKTSIKQGPFDVVRKVFSASEHKKMSIYDKSDLFFEDYSFGPLFNQENYLQVVPKASENNKKHTMNLVSKAADSFCEGDLIESSIRSKNAWGLLPTQAIFSSVLPGEYMSGYMQGQIQFPAFLGKLSKGNKCERLISELAVRTRLRAGVSKRAMGEELAQHLRNAIIQPMLDGGDVKASVGVMKEYSLLREDLDTLLEITEWPNKESPMKGVPAKTKAALTRLYNKEGCLTPDNLIRKGK